MYGSTANGKTLGGQAAPHQGMVVADLFDFRL
jgi:hypothetical protein